MAGVRLHHPDLRDCVFTIIHEGARLMRDGQPTTIRCELCHERHSFKTYHLFLDAVGDVVVSEDIYRRLIEAGLAPMVAMTEVGKPETFHLPLPTIGHAIDGRLAGTNGRPIRPGKEIVIAREGRR